MARVRAKITRHFAAPSKPTAMPVEALLFAECIGVVGRARGRTTMEVLEGGGACLSRPRDVPRASAHGLFFEPNCRLPRRRGARIVPEVDRVTPCRS